MPHRMTSAFIKTLLLSFVLLPLLAQGGPSSLKDGSLITVDPVTGKATRYTDSGTNQLWDGTHRLDDGSVVIVRDGIVISGANNQQAAQPEARQPLAPEATTASAEAVSPCMELMIKVCGFNGVCNKSPACSPARQLLKLEGEEAWRGGIKKGESAGQCREALQQEKFFKPCTDTVKKDQPTACEKLVTRVCGEDDACSDSKGCAPAKQLLEMETEELRLIQDASRPPETSKKCEEASRRRHIFPSCPLNDEDDDDAPDDCV